MLKARHDPDVLGLGVLSQANVLFLRVWGPFVDQFGKGGAVAFLVPLLPRHPRLDLHHAARKTRLHSALARGPAHADGNRKRRHQHRDDDNPHENGTAGPSHDLPDGRILSGQPRRGHQPTDRRCFRRFFQRASPRNRGAVGRSGAHHRFSRGLPDRLRFSVRHRLRPRPLHPRRTGGHPGGGGSEECRRDGRTRVADAPEPAGADLRPGLELRGKLSGGVAA